MAEAAQLALVLDAPSRECRCGAPWVGCCLVEPKPPRTGRMIYDVHVAPAGRPVSGGWCVRIQCDTETEACEQGRLAVTPDLERAGYNPALATATIGRAWRVDDPDCPWRV